MRAEGAGYRAGWLRFRAAQMLRFMVGGVLGSGQGGGWEGFDVPGQGRFCGSGLIVWGLEQCHTIKGADNTA